MTARTTPEPSYHAYHPHLTPDTAISLSPRIPLNIRYCTYLI